MITELTQNEVVLRQLAVADLLVQGAARVVVDRDHEAGVVELLLHLEGVLVEGRDNGHDEDLAGADPEGPLA